MTALFYSALHRLTAYLVEQGRRPTSHDLRERLVLQELPDIARYYQELKQRSEHARYWPIVEVRSSDVEALLGNEYQAILDGVSTRLLG